jgi:hypothetical protein
MLGGGGGGSYSFSPRLTATDWYAGAEAFAHTTEAVEVDGTVVGGFATAGINEQAAQMRFSFRGSSSV